MHRPRGVSGRLSRIAGFSLLELIVVLVILGLLASVVGSRVTKWVAEARLKTARLQIDELAVSIEKFRLDVGRYPTTVEGLGALLENNGLPNWSGPYLEKDFVPEDPWGKEYHYACPGEHRDYDLWTYGADGVPGGEGEARDLTSWGR